MILTPEQIAELFRLSGREGWMACDIEDTLAAYAEVVEQFASTPILACELWLMVDANSAFHKNYLAARKLRGLS